ncbi:MAG: quinolinate synthase NadA [Coprobacillaceae bacterium]
MNIEKEIEKLKKEKGIAILAHYYVPREVQEIADYVGDSFYLSKIATMIPEETIILCGVSFMGESAKLLCPNKTILLPDLDADCPMAHMANILKIKQIKDEYKDNVAVVCYVNSTATLKTYADVCVTSSNAYQVVSKLSQEYIYFIPDEHLGRYIAKKLPEKKFIFNDGYCHVHTSINSNALKDKKREYPDAIVVAHPECKEELLQEADYIGSTSEIIDYVTNNDFKECIVCTETGVLHELKKKNPETIFHIVTDKQICPNMKKVTLEKVYQCVLKDTNTVYLTPTIMQEAKLSLEKMMELTK